MKSSHQLILLLLVSALLILMPAAVNYFVDPYHMYGAKSAELQNLKRNDQYQTAGLIRSYLADESLGFNTLIMGNSHAQNFSPSQIEMTLDKGRVLKLCMAGSRPIRQHLVMSRALEEPAVTNVVWALDSYYSSHLFSTEMEQSDAFPSDLYGDDIGLTTYIFNMDVGLMSLKDLGLFPFGRSPQGDAYGDWYVDDELWNQQVATFHENIREDPTCLYNREYIASMSEQMPGSIGQLYSEFPLEQCPHIDRIAELVSMRPDVVFDFLIAPRPAACYICVTREDLASYFGMRRYAAMALGSLPNVRIHAFDNVEDIVVDLDRYKDYGHYHPDVNRYMIDSIPSGRHVLNSSNIDSYEQSWFDLLLAYQSHCLEQGPLSYPVKER